MPWQNWIISTGIVCGMGGDGRRRPSRPAPWCRATPSPRTTRACRGLPGTPGGARRRFQRPRRPSRCRASRALGHSAPSRPTAPHAKRPPPGRRSRPTASSTPSFSGSRGRQIPADVNGPFRGRGRPC
jgi:hypothetical protein